MLSVGAGYVSITVHSETGTQTIEGKRHDGA